jgi:hypothetical protein
VDSVIRGGVGELSWVVCGQGDKLQSYQARVVRHISKFVAVARRCAKGLRLKMLGKGGR